MKIIFKLLARINKWILPSYIYKDPATLRKIDKLIIAYRYWVTKNSLD